MNGIEQIKPKCFLLQNHQGTLECSLRLMNDGTNLNSKTVSIIKKKNEKTLRLSPYLLAFIVSTLLLVIKILIKTENCKNGRHSIVFVKQERN